MISFKRRRVNLLIKVIQFLIFFLFLFLVMKSFINDPTTEQTKKKLDVMQVEANSLLRDAGDWISSQPRFRQATSSLSIDFAPIDEVNEFLETTEKKLLWRNWIIKITPENRKFYCKDGISLSLSVLSLHPDMRKIGIFMSYNSKTITNCS